MARIFIVDDEQFIIELYRDVLTLKSHTIAGIAYDGEEAIRKYKSFNEKPDIILMDHRMPVKNGVEATREILRLDPRAIIIFGSADVFAESEALAAGARAFLPKPFRIDELLEVVARYSKPEGHGGGRFEGAPVSV